jgi:hypothetical protein
MNDVAARDSASVMVVWGTATSIRLSHEALLPGLG